MKTILRITIIIGMLIATAYAQNDATEEIAKGDSFYDKLDNKSALTHYLAAIEIDSLNYEANWKASRALTDVGEMIEDEDERAEYYLRGSKCAQRAVRIDSMGAKGHLYLSISLGRVALDAGAKERIKLSG